MKFLVAACIINLVQLIDFCAPDKHSHGERREYMNHRMYHRTLIDDYNVVPKNYTIIYKYFGSYFKPIASIEIDVNVPSSGYIHETHESRKRSHDRGTDTIQVYDAKVHIDNAFNVTAVLTICGLGIMSISSMGWMSRDVDTTSLTFVYVKNAIPPVKAKPFAQNSIGHRRKGDKLIHFESRNVTNASRFPSRSFEYTGGDEYITYVGFSFNSPTAMVMVNTSYVSEQEFNAVVYDMNTEHFVANMSVYGVKSTIRPDKFLGVI